MNPPQSSPRLGLRTLSLLRRVLDRPHAHRWIIATSTLILCLSLDTGFSADDYAHTLMLEDGRQVHGFSGRAPWDLFRFTSPEITPQLQVDGVLSWWDDPRGRFMFLRPLSSATHALDHWLFPHSAVLQHLHSVLWGLVVFLGIWALYRQLIPPSLMLGLTVFLYVLDDARAWFSSWVAGRNTVVATAFSVWTLVYYVAHRQTGKRSAHAAALVLWPLALSSGEGSVAVSAYMVSYALFLDRQPRTKALMALTPYGVIAVTWRVIYKSLGYGAAHSFLYVDPADAPLTFIERLIERGPVLWMAQLGGPWSDNWSSFFVFPRFRIALYVAAVLSVIIFTWLVWPLLRREGLLRFAAMGAVLSTVPASAAFPADRLLNWIAIGGAPLLAAVLIACLEQPARGSLKARFIGVVGGYLLLVHLVVAPLIMTSRVRGNVELRDVLERADAGVPKDPSIADKQVFYVNPPALPLASYIPMMRAVRREPMPKSQLVLGIGTVPMTVRRIDAHTLELSTGFSLMWNPGSQLLVGPDTRFAPGDERVVGDAHIRILGVDERGAPLRFTVQLPQPLDDPHYLFLQWGGATYKPFTPPPVSNEITLPGADYLQTLFGKKMFIEAKYPES